MYPMSSNIPNNWASQPHSNVNRLHTNFAERFSKNIRSRRLDQRLIHSRFNQSLIFRWNAFYCSKYFIQSCDFMAPNRLVVASDDGFIRVYNLFTGQKEFACPAYPGLHLPLFHIDHIESSNSGKLLLLSSRCDSRMTLCSIVKRSTSTKYSLNDVEYCTFSNYCQNKLLGCKNLLAMIYDVETSQKLMTLGQSSSYRWVFNKPVFDATNKLVLYGGVLWDTAAGKKIHRLIRLDNSRHLNTSDIFHPNRLEIISNTKVLDLRTFKLLRSVPSLDGCNVLFPKTGESMYAYRPTFGKSFQTLDPNDYSNIATIDMKNTTFIGHMACNIYDTKIAIVARNRNEESTVQIYDVGRSRVEDEPIEEEEVLSDGTMGYVDWSWTTESDSGSYSSF